MRLKTNELTWLTGLVSMTIFSAACSDNGPQPPPPRGPEASEIYVRTIHLAPSSDNLEAFYRDRTQVVRQPTDIGFGQFSPYRVIYLAKEDASPQEPEVERPDDEKAPINDEVTTNGGDEAQGLSVPINIEGLEPEEDAIRIAAAGETDPLFVIKASELLAFLPTNDEDLPVFVSVVIYEQDNDEGEPEAAVTVIKDDLSDIAEGESRLAGLHVAAGFEALDVTLGEASVFAALGHVADGGEPTVSPLTAPLTDDALTITHGEDTLACEEALLAQDAGYTAFVVASEEGLDLHIIESETTVDGGSSLVVPCTFVQDIDNGDDDAGDDDAGDDANEDAGDEEQTVAALN